MRDKHRLLLGNMFDWEVAQIAKVSPALVRKERVAAGIPPVCKCCRNDVLRKRGPTCRAHNPHLHGPPLPPARPFAEERAELREELRQLEAAARKHAAEVDRLIDEELPC